MTPHVTVRQRGRCGHRLFVAAAHVALTVAAAVTLLPSAPASAAPQIRTDHTNAVPSCVTPERLMAFVLERNPSLNPRFNDIAHWYKYFGDAWRVRWDYAFFQMAIETNFLKFRRADGRSGDVRESQNNFAGIGATGGGVPGDRFPDVKTGVHAQIQHLVAYSGERLAAPIAPRTRLKQNDIIEVSLQLRRPVTFGDLARRWAVDRHYARSIDFVAGQFNGRYCSTTASNPASASVPAPRPARRGPFPPPSGLGGPKPQKLAGPPEDALAEEVLPWAKPKAPAMAQTAPAPRSPEAKPGTRKPPVRTIWSRGDDATLNPPPSVTPKVAPSPVTPSLTPSQAQDEPAGAVITGATTSQDRGSAEAPAQPSNDELPALPLFRIAPIKPEPSRLGGPIPAPATDRTANANAVAKSQSGTRGGTPCRVLTASYGGHKTLLLRTREKNGTVAYTALTVLDGFEKSMLQTYSKAKAPGAELVGEYDTKDAALADAHANCSRS